MENNNIKELEYIKKLEQQCREAEKKYQAFFLQTRDLLYIATKDGIILDINPAGIDLLGYSKKEELLNTSFLNLYLNAEDRKYYIKQMMVHDFIKDFEIVLKRKDGQKIFGIETAFAVKNTKGEIIEFRGIIRDNTENVKQKMKIMKINFELSTSHKKLQDMYDKMIHQEKLASIGQLAAGFAHEINNPLGFIKANFESLNKYFKFLISYIDRFENILSKNENNQVIKHIIDELLSAKQDNNVSFIVNDLRQLFQECGDGFKRIMMIVNSFRNFARINDIKKFKFQDLNSIIEDTLIVARNEIKNYAYIDKRLNDIPPVQCIPGELNQVFLNIIINAIQAIQEQKGGIGKISIQTKKQDEFVVCHITDDGPGIPKEDISKIFDPFFTTKVVGKGTGLGLNISYQIIQKHNGELKVASTLGKGTTFTLKLPIVHRVGDENE